MVTLSACHERRVKIHKKGSTTSLASHCWRWLCCCWTRRFHLTGTIPLLSNPPLTSRQPIGSDRSAHISPMRHFSFLVSPPTFSHFCSPRLASVISPIFFPTCASAGFGSAYGRPF